MKNSKIEWVGEIPAPWEVMSNKHLMQKQKIICPIYKGQAILSLTMKGVIERDLDAGGKMPSSFDGYQYVKRGNLLLCLFDIDVTPRCAGLILKDGVTSPAYSQYIMRQKAYAPYYSYYYVMVDNTKELLHMAKNLRHSLNEEQFGAIKAPVPPLSEQKAIAEFLDKKCGEVDALIADIQQEIETLEQYKRSVITESVTKGLDPSVPMKDSGIDWIGDIPEHWKVSKLKYLFKTVSGNGFNIDLQGEESGDYPFCKASDISIANKDLNKAQNYVTEQVARLNRYNIIPQGSIIFAKIGEAMKKNNRAICRCACCIDNNCQALIPLSVINDIYSYYLLKCVDMQWFDNAGTIPCISIRKLMNSSIVFPSLLEQKAIVTFLDKKCKEIEEVIADKQLQIETLESYKKSLIYEYVTGKKEIIAQ